MGFGALLKYTGVRPNKGLAPAEIEVAKYILRCNKQNELPSRETVFEEMAAMGLNKNAITCALEGLLKVGIIEEIEPDVLSIY